MLTEEQIREALRPLVKQETTLDMLLAIGMDEYLAIEQAVLQHVKLDTVRLRIQIADLQKAAEALPWVGSGADWSPALTSCGDCGEFVLRRLAIDAARGQT